MKFGEKVAECRKKEKMTQQELGALLGISKRSIINYEVNGGYPKKREVYAKLAEIFHHDINYFLTEEEELVTQATEEYGAKGAREAKRILEQTSALFAGGDLDESDRRAFFEAMNEIYFDAKKKAKKYTPKKYRQEK